MKPAFDIHGLDVRTQLLLHAIVLLASLPVGFFLCFDGMLAWLPFQWIAAIGVAELVYFLFAYLLVGASFVDPLERLFEDSTKQQTRHTVEALGAPTFIPLPSPGSTVAPPSRQYRPAR